MAIRKVPSNKRRTTGNRTRGTRVRPIWERIKELGHSIPLDELALWPTDAAANFDHYLDGTPKPRESALLS
jgi:hypothetical protein